MYYQVEQMYLSLLKYGASIGKIEKIGKNIICVGVTGVGTMTLAPYKRMHFDYELNKYVHNE